MKQARNDRCRDHPTSRHANDGVAIAQRIEEKQRVSREIGHSEELIFADGLPDDSVSAPPYAGRQTAASTTSNGVLLASPSSLRIAVDGTIAFPPPVSAQIADRFSCFRIDHWPEPCFASSLIERAPHDSPHGDCDGAARSTRFAGLLD